MIFSDEGGEELKPNNPTKGKDWNKRHGCEVKQLMVFGNGAGGVDKLIDDILDDLEEGRNTHSNNFASNYASEYFEEEPSLRCITATHKE